MTRLASREHSRVIIIIIIAKRTWSASRRTNCPATTFHRFSSTLHPCFLVDECLGSFVQAPPRNHCRLPILSPPILVFSSLLFLVFAGRRRQFSATQPMEYSAVKSFSTSSAASLGSCPRTGPRELRRLAEWAGITRQSATDSPRWMKSLFALAISISDSLCFHFSDSSCQIQLGWT